MLMQMWLRRVRRLRVPVTPTASTCLEDVMRHQPALRLIHVSPIGDRSPIKRFQEEAVAWQWLVIARPSIGVLEPTFLAEKNLPSRTLLRLAEGLDARLEETRKSNPLSTITSLRNTPYVR